MVKKTKEMDMLNGPLLKKIILFALPLAASSILQQLFNSADVAVVGRFAGSDALAAVGGNGAVINLLINLFVGMSVGANVLIAGLIGKGQEKKINEAIHTVMSIALISGLVLIILGTAAARPILLLMDTPPKVLDMAVLYLRIYFLGMPFIMVYNFGSAVLRSRGDTKRPLYCLIVSGIINVCLNMLLVVGFDLSVLGVAIATFVSNGVSAVMILYYLINEQGNMQLSLKKLSLKKEYILQIIKIGVPAGVQGMVFSLSNVCIQTAINGFGTNAIAGSAAAVNYEFFTYFVTSAFCQAAVTFTSQNYGAGKTGRCRKVYWICMILSVLVTETMSIIFVIGRDFFAGIYTSHPADVKFAVIRMLHVQILECMPCLYEIPGGVLRGMGYSMTPAVLTLLGSCGLRIVWLMTVFKAKPSFETLMNVYPFTWLVTSILVIGAYYIVRKRAEGSMSF